MSVSGISSYSSSALLQWQGQQLQSTGTSKSSQSSASSTLNKLFGGNKSMTSQLSSMVELTKYAMDAMGISSDSRVTFSQITKYREQLTTEFNQSVKNGLANLGVSDLGGLTFTLDAAGSITAASATASDQKKAQKWLNANPSLGKDLRASLTAAGIDAGTKVNMSVDASGKISVVNAAQRALQNALNVDAALTDSLRTAFTELGAELGMGTGSGVSFVFDGEGNLVLQDESAQAANVNAWLAKNTNLADTLKKQMSQYGIDATSVSVTLNATGNIQATVNNADLTAVQTLLNTSNAGKTLAKGLESLGVAANAKFSLQTNDDGSVSVISDSADKNSIQQFFDDNPGLIKKYRQIEALAGLDDARKAMQVSPSELRKRIQIESMASWWAGSGNASSYFGNYSNNNLSLMSGLNLSV